MKKINEIIVNAFYVHDEVIEEPSCVEESFYEVDEDEDLDNFLRFLMKNRKLVKPFIHKKREKKEVLVFKAENLSAVIPYFKSEKVLQKCKDIMAGKARRCDKCGAIILDKYFCTYRDLHGMVGLSYECCACRGVSDRSINRVYESYQKCGTKKTQIKLLKRGRI